MKKWDWRICPVSRVFRFIEGPVSRGPTVIVVIQATITKTTVTGTIPITATAVTVPTAATTTVTIAVTATVTVLFIWTYKFVEGWLSRDLAALDLSNSRGDNITV